MTLPQPIRRRAAWAGVAMGLLCVVASGAGDIDVVRELLAGGAPVGADSSQNTPARGAACGMLAASIKREPILQRGQE